METFNADGLTFEVSDIGGTDVRNTILLLHGFPQDLTAWSDVAPQLVDAGYRVLMPNMRGYSPLACPPDRRRYGSPRLIADLVTLLDTAGIGRVHVVGHDWGGALLWTMRKTHAHRLASVTIVSTPHPRALSWGWTHTNQLMRSWYMGAVALPRLPEYVLQRHLAQLVTRTSLPHSRANYYQSRFQTHPELATGALNWYRQMLVEQVQPPRHEHPSGDPTPPTLYVAGDRDAYFNPSVVAHTALVDPSVTMSTISGGHWLPETHADELTVRVVDHVTRSTA